MKPRLPLLLLGAAFFACSLAPAFGGKSSLPQPFSAVLAAKAAQGAGLPSGF